MVLPSRAPQSPGQSGYCPRLLTGTPVTILGGPDSHSQVAGRISLGDPEITLGGRGEGVPLCLVFLNCLFLPELMRITSHVHTRAFG